MGHNQLTSETRQESASLSIIGVLHCICRLAEQVAQDFPETEKSKKSDERYCGVIIVGVKRNHKCTKKKAKCQSNAEKR